MGWKSTILNRKKNAPILEKYILCIGAHKRAGRNSESHGNAELLNCVSRRTQDGEVGAENSSGDARRREERGDPARGTLDLEAVEVGGTPAALPLNTSWWATLLSPDPHTYHRHLSTSITVPSLHTHPP